MEQTHETPPPSRAARPPSRAARPFTFRFFLACLAFYAAAALLLTFPLDLNLRSGIPGGRAEAMAFRDLWAVGWVDHQALRDPASVLAASVFHPTPSSLAFGELLLPESLLALPVAALWHDPVAAFNVAVLVLFVLAGLAGCVLLAGFGCGRGPSLLAGLAVAAAPYRFEAPGRIDMLGAVWVALALAAFYSFVRKPGLARAASLGFALSLAFLSSLPAGGQAILGCAVAFPFVFVTGRRFVSVRFYIGVLASLLVVIVLVAPFLPRRLRVAATAEQAPALDNGYSLHEAYLVGAAPSSLVYGRLAGLTPRPGAWVHPGAFVLAAAILGFLFALAGCGPGRRLPALCLLLSGTAAAAAAFRPPGLGGRLAEALLPPGAMGLLLSVSAAALAGFALDGVTRSGRFARAFTATAGLAILAEGIAVPFPLTAVDRPRPEVTAYLGRLPRGAAVVHLPTQGGGPVNARHIALSTVPTVNGYGTQFPPGYRDGMMTLDGFPDPPSLAFLMERRVRAAVVHLDAYPAAGRARVIERIDSLPSVLRRAFSQGDTVVVEINASPEALKEVRTLMENTPLPPLPAFEGPVCFEERETLEYEAKVMGFLSAGTLTTEVLAPKTPGTVHLRMTGRPSAMARKFFDGTVVFEDRVDARTFLPIESGMEMARPGKNQKVDVKYTRGPDETQAVVNQRLIKLVPPDTLSSLAALFRLRCTTLSPGDRFLVPVFENGSLVSMELSVRGPEQVSTSAGRFLCHSLELNPRGGGGGELQGPMTVWIADEAPHVPVRLEVTVKFGAVKLDLVKRTP